MVSLYGSTLTALLVSLLDRVFQPPRAKSGYRNEEDKRRVSYERRVDCGDISPGVHIRKRNMASFPASRHDSLNTQHCMRAASPLSLSLAFGRGVICPGQPTATSWNERARPCRHTSRHRIPPYEPTQYLDRVGLGHPRLERERERVLRWRNLHCTVPSYGSYQVLVGHLIGYKVHLARTHALCGPVACRPRLPIVAPADSPDPSRGQHAGLATSGWRVGIQAHSGRWN